LLADNAGTILPENIQGANVAIGLPQAVVCITYPSTMTSCPIGAPSIPVTVGSSYTVGVFVQNSQPMGGFDIYVQVDSHYVNPTSAALGPLIVSPTSTNICIDGQTIQGQCTAAINGQGIVEVSTFDSSGLNECSAPPCSGLAFTITYQILLPTPTTQIIYPTDAAAPGFCSPSSVSSPTPPPNVCVSVNDATGPTLSEIIQRATFTQIPFTHTTIPPIICDTPAPVFQLVKCTVTITDNATSGAINPINTSDRPVVTWTTDGFGVFQPVNTCTIDRISAVSSSCHVFYLPLQVGGGTHNIGVLYLGDTVHSGTTASPPPAVPTAFPLPVSKANVTISTFITVDKTGQAPPGGFVQSGALIRDHAIMTGGAPPQGVSGTVTYTVFAGGACSGTGTIISTVPVGLQADNVPDSGPFAAAIVSVPTLFSLHATYNGDGNNFASTSTCEPFTVSQLFPSITHAHFTHHLSLAKSSNTQSWTFTVNNPLTSSVSVVIRIQGHSAINPSLAFDVVCGTICVNTPSGGVNAINATIVGPRSIAAGATVSISFGQFISSSFANNTLSFTATVFWTTGTGYTSGGTNTGSFSVVP